jgi:autotransporter-associated beta strand protein
MKPSLSSESGRLNKIGALTLTVVALWPALMTQAADISWTGGTASYTNAANWGGTVPGPGDTAINDNGTNNVVQINTGNPDWTIGRLRAGNGTGSGAFEQNGQTVTVNVGPRPFRLGVAPGFAGVYTLNGGTLIFTNGDFVVGQLGPGILNLNGGTISGSANFGVNIGTSIDAVNATMDGGTNRTGFTWFEQGLYTTDPTRGLPPAGSTFASISDATHSYTMPSSYAGTSSLMLNAGVPNGVVTLTSPTACSGLSFLGSAGNGTVNVSYTVHHADSTIETGNISVLDWFATNAPAWSAGGRVPANGLGFQIISAPNNPNLYSFDIVLTNTTSAVTSINLTYGSGGVACLFALSGSSGGNFDPLAISGYNADMVLDLATPIYVSNTVTSILNQVSGVITNTGEFWVGNYGVGIYNLSGGTNSIANWIAIGRSGGNGTLNMTGGVLNKSGNGNLLVGTGFQAPVGSTPVGVFNHSAGTINCLNEFQIPENSPATGTYNLSGTGVLNANDWLAIGRNGGAGVVNMSGGTIAKTGGGGFLAIGASGNGTLTQTGGLITNTLTDTLIGQTGTGNGTWNLNGGSAIVGVVHIGQNAGAVGTLNLNSGLLRATEVTSGNAGSFSTLNLNGGTLQASADATAFLHDLTLAFVQAGGAVIDSQGFNITVAQPLLDSGGGGLTKNGTGTVTLTGDSTYTGATVVNAGVLNAATASSGGGSYTVANGAGGMGVVVVVSLNSQLNASSVTLPSTATVFNFDLGAFGNPTLAPLNVVGALTVNGTVTVNIADALPQIGQFPLIKYGSIAGSGGFVIGSTPFGVVASISNNVANNSIDLVVISVNAPRWEGQAGGNWDISVTTNWINLGDNSPTFYTDGSTVIFDDSASGTTTVNLVATVHPQSIKINNTNLNYTLTGSGKISGTIGLNKQGTGTFAVLNTGGNNFTGPVILSAGTLSVTNLANGGSPSAIGASSASPTNLVFAGGTLSYSGPPTTINRSYYVPSASAIETVSNLTLSGVGVVTTGGEFQKKGAGQLAYTGSGSNALSGYLVGGSRYRVAEGTVLLDGSVGNQTNFARNLSIGLTAGIDTAMVVSNSILDVRNAFAIGDHNTATATFTMKNSTVFQRGNANVIDIGDNNGVACTGVVIQDNSTLDSGGEIWVGQTANGVGSYTFNSGLINLRNWLAIGRSGGNGTFNMTGGTFIKSGNGNFIVGTAAGNNTLPSMGVLNQSGGTIFCTNEYWIAENALDFGTNNISGSAVVNWFNWVSIGRRGHGVLNITGGTINRSGGGVAIVIGDNLQAAFPGNGYVNQSGGTLTSQNELWVGQGNGSVGQYDLSGTGSVTISNWVAIGRGGAVGTFNLSGGSLAKTGTGGNHFLIGAGGNGTLNQTGGTLTNVLSETRVADGGTGTWNISGGSAVLGVLHISQNSGTTGTLNLNGGTLAATEVSMFNPGGNSTLNLNGGTLIARNGANANFLHDLSTNNVQAGGAIIDSGTNTINVAQALLDGGGGGGLTKLGNGTLNLNGVNTYTGPTLVNFGTLGGTGTIASSVTVASGAALAPGTSIGTLTVNNSVTLGGTAVMEVSRNGGVPASDLLTVSGNLAVSGPLTVVLTGTNALAFNDTFNLFDWGTQSGSFAVTNLPAGYFWNTSQLYVNGTIRVIGVPPRVTSVTTSGGNLILTGVGGPPGAGYTLLSSTNITAPRSTWTTNLTGVFDGSAAFSNAVPINLSQPARFFILRAP